jgi:peptide/nickel transport system permease protein
VSTVTTTTPTATAAEAPAAAVSSNHRANVLGRRALRIRQTQIGLAITAVMVFIAFVGPYFAPHDPHALVGLAFGKPSSSMPLGTDYLGHDVLSVLLAGGRTVVWMSLVSVLLGLAAGTVIGVAAAYSRSWIDGALMRSTDVVLAFPNIVLVLLFVSLLGPKPWLIVLLVAAAWAPQVARVARGAALEIVGKEFVESSEVLGVPQWRIMVRDILPNITGPLMVEFGIRVTWSVGLIAGISFLGAGIQPPAADWGLMINQNRAGIVQQPWGVLAPVLCIALLTIGVNMTAEGLTRAVAGGGRKEDPR